MTKDDLFRGLTKMEGYNHLTEDAEILLHLLIEGASIREKAGAANLEKWMELAQCPRKSVWTKSFACAEELKEKGFIRGYFGKAGHGILRATFTDALLEAAQGEEE